LERLPDYILRSVRRQISMLADDPRPHDVRKLVGGLGWRIRVGEWRIIYEIDDDRRLITIAAVKSRQSAYK
jgi:mRNA interferase RelE/StbE